MKDSDEKKTFDRSFHPVESRSNDEKLSSKRRHLLKGVALGLPAILTLPRGAAAIAMTSSTDRCVEKCTAATPELHPFDPNSSPGDTWLIKSVEVFTYTDGNGSQEKYYYQDKSAAWRTYPGGVPEAPPPGWMQAGSAFKPALGYFDISGSEPVCKWYGPGNSDGGIALNQSCYHSITGPGGGTPTC